MDHTDRLFVIKREVMPPGMCARGRLRRKTMPAAAFTLIELLIVVAIIAILAAIAIPNFLEAQTRAKVSRAKSDLRTLALAVEAYRLDHNKYPLTSDEKGEPIVPYPPVGLGPEVFETRLSALLTTPVAYVTTLFEDPFAAQKPDEEDPRIVEGTGYHYGYYDYAVANDGLEGKWDFTQVVLIRGGNPAVIEYFVSSHGPDLDHDDDEELIDDDAGVAYDPTNGTASSGDIILMGPSGGFAR